MNDKPVFLDSNICLYLLSKDSTRKHTAETLLALPVTIISSQVINETINICIKKFCLPQQRITDHILFLMSCCRVVTISEVLQIKAIALHFRYQFSFYDSLIVAAALEAGCQILYSEDMQHELLVNNSLRIINPFV
ncbi:putative nucleic acid-binding protein [Proteiniphilum saccharofermentans]|uniref:Putative nucleic acid-binding protein n=1 Tax=Proteiniphilum saccharofermentans TaxID=1642647 RepID=A0A1R3T259_9BACT|nr:PIN domain-containing protein [Proteiniphilum saccharofermentans]SCD20119.1 putative nucleic acid-binding protein [Proteiniphilum saccharofermentans]